MCTIYNCVYFTLTIFVKVVFYVFESTVFNTVSSASPQSCKTVSEDAGIEPKTVAKFVLAVRQSNHSARSHPLIHYYFIAFFNY
jgi:hypothetical protein